MEDILGRDCGEIHDEYDEVLKDIEQVGGRLIPCQRPAREFGISTRNSRPGCQNRRITRRKRVSVEADGRIPELNEEIVPRRPLLRESSRKASAAYASFASGSWSSREARGGVRHLSCAGPTVQHQPARQCRHDHFPSQNPCRFRDPSRSHQARPVVQALRQRRDRFVAHVCVTRNTGKCSIRFSSIFRLRVQYDLNITAEGTDAWDRISTSRRCLQGSA